MLYLFDVDGTLVRSFLREGAPRSEYGLIELLPNRVETIAALEAGEERSEFALITNQAGVAMGYQSKREVCRKMATIAGMLGIKGAGLARCRPGVLLSPEGLPYPRGIERRCATYVSFGHVKAKLPEYRVPEDDDWRKPGPGMILQAVEDFGATVDDVIMVGDMDSDREAAENATVAYMDADGFFGA